VLLAVTAFLTAFYMFRVVFLAFFARAHHAGHAHHHVPLAMTVVCWLLGGLTLAMGLTQAFLRPHEAEGPGWLPPFSLAVAGAGIVLAWAMYQRGLVDPARAAAVLGPIDWMARRRYGLDALFAGVYRGVLLVFARLVGWIDRYVVDGVLNVLSAWTLRAGDRLRRLQSGQPQDYVYGVALGALLLFVLATWRLR
jgi:NADH-quinone oxidoreductase subunit L